MLRNNGAVRWLFEKRWVLLFIAVAVFIALCLPMSVDRFLPVLIREKTEWSLPEDAVCLYPERSAELKGYEVDGNRLIPVDSDPQMGFALRAEAMRCLLVDLAEPAADNTEVEVYYDAKTGGLSEANKVKAMIRGGDSQLLVDIPAAANDYIRVDINGAVTLNGIYYTNSAFVENRVQLPLSRRAKILVYAACALFFAVLLLSLGMALFHRKGKPGISPYIIAATARVWLGSMAGVWYPQDQGYDDALIFHYSNLASYLSGREVVSRDVMLKELGMPLILNIVNISGVSYAIFLSLLWVLCGGLAALLVRRMNRRKRPRVEFLTFAFVLFQPIALEHWTGTRLYRNALLTPMYLLVFLFALIILYDLADGRASRRREALWCSLPLGIVFSLAYLIKEDGIWLLLSVAALAVMMLCAWVCSLIKKRFARGGAIKALIAICVPFVMLFLSIAAVRQVNYKAFGVYATNARTAGEEGKFVTYVYKAASDDRSLDVWAPADAIEKVFKASETLRNNKALKKAVFRTPWQSGSIKKHPIQGDFLTWVMKDALFDSGTVATKREAEQYMRKVNRELEAAFADGALEADRGFRLTGSMAGISGSDIPSLLNGTLTGYKNMLSTRLYSPGAAVQINDKDDTQYASIMANQDLNTVGTEDATRYRKYEVVIANGIIGVFFHAHDYIQPVLLALGCLALVFAVCDIIQSIKRRIPDISRFARSWLILYFAALSFVYLFMIAWFTYFLHNEYFSYFYSIGALPLIVLFEINGLSLLRDHANRRPTGARRVGR